MSEHCSSPRAMARTHSPKTRRRAAIRCHDGAASGRTGVTTANQVNSLAVATLLLTAIADDAESPVTAREEARLSITAGLPADELTVQLELDRIYNRAVNELDYLYEPPVGALSKAVVVRTFLSFYADRDTRAEWGLLPREYGDYVARSADPDGMVSADVCHDADALLIPRAHSWLIPSDSLTGLDGDEVCTLLRLPDATPPLVILNFPLERSVPGGVMVRPPVWLDTLPARDAVWRPGAVIGEKVDRDVRRNCCGGAEWRP